MTDDDTQDGGGPSGAYVLMKIMIDREKAVMTAVKGRLEEYPAAERRAIAAILRRRPPGHPEFHASQFVLTILDSIEP